MAPETPAAVELRGLTKRFGSVVANDGVNLRIQPGTIHGVIGENGAGKSTAMKMLYGIFPPDAGEIIVHGKTCVWESPADAIAAGIGMVHQHFMLAGPYTALDNILLGAEPVRLRRDRSTTGAHPTGIPGPTVRVGGRLGCRHRRHFPWACNSGSKSSSCCIAMRGF